MKIIRIATIALGSLALAGVAMACTPKPTPPVCVEECQTPSPAVTPSPTVTPEPTVASTPVPTATPLIELPHVGGSAQ